MSCTPTLVKSVPAGPAAAAGREGSSEAQAGGRRPARGGPAHLSAAPPSSRSAPPRGHTGGRPWRLLFKQLSPPAAEGRGGAVAERGWAHQALIAMLGACSGAERRHAAACCGPGGNFAGKFRIRRSEPHPTLPASLALHAAGRGASGTPRPLPSSVQQRWAAAGALERGREQPWPATKPLSSSATRCAVGVTSCSHRRASGLGRAPCAPWPLHSGRLGAGQPTKGDGVHPWPAAAARCRWPPTVSLPPALRVMPCVQPAACMLIPLHSPAPVPPAVGDSCFVRAEGCVGVRRGATAAGCCCQPQLLGAPPSRMPTPGMSTLPTLVLQGPAEQEAVCGPDPEAGARRAARRARGGGALVSRGRAPRLLHLPAWFCACPPLGGPPALHLTTFHFLSAQLPLLQVL